MYTEFIKLYEDKKLWNYFKKTSYEFYHSSILIYYIEYEDYFQEQQLRLCRKYNKKNLKSYKSSTLIYLSVRSTFLSLLEKYNKEKRQINNPKNLFFLDKEVPINKEKSFHEVITSNLEVTTPEFLRDDFYKHINDGDKKIVNLLYQGYKYKEICTELSIPYGTLCYRINKIRDIYSQFYK